MKKFKYSLFCILLAALALSFSACNNFANYTVRFYVDGGLYGLVEQGEFDTVNVPAPQKNGCTFVSWCTDTSLQNEIDCSAEFLAEILKNVSLYAKFEVSTENENKETYSVRFYVDGALYSVVKQGEYDLIHIKSPVKSGFAFEGWYTDVALQNKIDWSAEYLQNVDNDVCLFAKFEVVVNGENWTIGNAFDFEYEELDNKIIINKYIGTAQNLIIPALLDGKKVEAIGDFAFYAQRDIRRIKLSDGISSVGVAAFANSSIEKIYLGTVEQISDKAFLSCGKLTEVGGTSKVKTIGIGAFNLCENLTSFKFGSSIENFGRNSFGFANLKVIDLSACNKLITIPSLCFDGNSNGKNIEIKLPMNGVLSVIETAAFAKLETDELVIPASVERIEFGAFQKCKIADIFFVDNSRLSYIGKCAFSDPINFPDGVSFGEGDNSSAYAVPDTPIQSQIGEKIHKFIKIPASVTFVGEGAFYNFADSYFFVPQSIDIIESSAFMQTLGVYTDAAERKNGWNTLWANEYSVEFGQTSDIIQTDGFIIKLHNDFGEIIGVISQYEYYVPRKVTFGGKNIAVTKIKNMLNMPSVSMAYIPDTILEISYGAICAELILCETYVKPDGWNDFWYTDPFATISWGVENKLPQA